MYMKTIERAHMPKKLWEKIPLDKSYKKVSPSFSHPIGS